MVRYVPILKGMPGELTAWTNVSPAVARTTTPLFELVPKHGLGEDLTNFAARAKDACLPGQILATDAGYLDQEADVAGTGLGAIAWLGRELGRHGVVVRPVVRLDDADAVLTEAGAVAATHGAGVVLRLGGYENDPDPTAAAAGLQRVLKQVNLPTAKVHLLVDVFEIKDSRDAARAQLVAQAVLGWAATSGPWASTTLASGAFPASVSNLGKATANYLDRFDASLWTAVSASGVTGLDYGDYAINNPTLPAGSPRGPLPSIRYTSGDKWLVWREAKSLPGYQSFFTVAAQVTALSDFSGASYSWGDAELARCATSTGGPGGAVQWRSYGTSHHLQVVVDRLTSSGAP